MKLASLTLPGLRRPETLIINRRIALDLFATVRMGAFGVFSPKKATRYIKLHALKISLYRALVFCR